MPGTQTGIFSGDLTNRAPQFVGILFRDITGSVYVGELATNQIIRWTFTEAKGDIGLPVGQIQGSGRVYDLQLYIRIELAEIGEVRHQQSLRQTIGHGTYSDKALKVREVGHAIYAPVIYFPQRHVRMEYLTLTAKSTECPLKGVTECYDIQLHGKIYKHAAWVYKTVYEFDERLQLLQGQMAFDTAAIQVLELTTIVLPPL